MSSCLNSHPAELEFNQIPCIQVGGLKVLLFALQLLSSLLQAITRMAVSIKNLFILLVFYLKPSCLLVELKNSLFNRNKDFFV